MAAKQWLERIRAIDVRLIAAVGAALLLIAGVMWTIPTTPESNSFTFDTARRDLSNARAIEINKPMPGEIVDGSDIDYYRINSGAGGHLQIHVQTDSGTLVPALDIYDAAKKIIDERLGSDYVLVGQPDTRYYIQVSGQRSTTGRYTLTINDSANFQ